MDSRSNDRWFQHVAIVVSDMDRAYARLRRFKVQHASTGPQLLPKPIPGAAGIRAFYFRDPDGHPLEVIRFPADKGDPRWQRSGGRLFLGIDHTAIVVGSTAASLAFYRDVLGFRVAGESLNQDEEQERLNNVEGARLRITGLRAAAGPGIEVLEYLAPRDGRPFTTGFSPVVFEEHGGLGKNGVLVLSSVTGGNRRIEVPADRINLEFVLGNKVMVGTVNANREYFELGVKDLAQAEAQYPGWLQRLLTHPVQGHENWRTLLETLTAARGAIKVYCVVTDH